MMNLCLRRCVGRVQRLDVTIYCENHPNVRKFDQDIDILIVHGLQGREKAREIQE